METATISNSKPRKQLGDQLDRLDTILDVLSEGLNSSVADAAREGTRLAVKDALIEIMTDPTLRSRLHEASAPEPAQSAQPSRGPGLWARLKAKAARTVASVGRLASRAVAGAAGSVQGVADTVVGGVRALQGLGSLKQLAVVGIGVGIVLGLASFLAPHAVAAAVSGVSGAVAATAVQIGAWTRRTLHTLSLA